MEEVADDTLALWAKRRRAAGDPGYHPLICHLIDVAAVADAMWRSVIPPATRRWFAAGLGVDEASAGQWVTLWAGLHDIGKASPAFQGRSPEARERLADRGLICPPVIAMQNHATVSAIVLPDILTATSWNLPKALADCVASVLGGHHGRIPSSAELNGQRRHQATEPPGWPECRVALAVQLRSSLTLPEVAPSCDLDHARQLWLAGLISVADWIGSDENLFPYSVGSANKPTVLVIADYVEESRHRAQKALRDLGWLARPLSVASRSFSDLFPAIREPNELQIEAIALADRLSEPTLIMIEAPMGTGKSEAAMFLADHAMAKHDLRGIFFALPTRTTSDQMFGRVRSYLSRRFAGSPVELQLLHGHAALSAEFQLLVAKGGTTVTPSSVGEDLSSNDEPLGVLATRWFTYRKRGLLAPFGVGTIDQALLAALQTRHVFVRLFGLARRTVIIDEAHAYDAYMTRLLERLLAWLAALECTVVILSATLPEVRRNALLNAYASGRESGKRSESPSPNADTASGEPSPTESRPIASYPRITWVHHGKVESVGNLRFTQRSLSVRRLVNGNLTLSKADELIGAQLAVALAEGGCAAVICNTVDRAQRVYRALRSYFPGVADDGDAELDLLHARYPFEDRERREQRAERRFGKPGDDVRRPWRAVLVATQVIEQSLDFDFDLIVTDLAPIDLLLQRAGRLHRHVRSNRAWIAEPMVWIRWPIEEGGRPRFSVEDTYVYDPHVLLRSWWALKDLTSIEIPDDIPRLVDLVYQDESAAPPSAAPALSDYWNDSWRRLIEARRDEELEARDRWIPHPLDRDAPLWHVTKHPREEDDPEFHHMHQALTRLGEPSIDVVCLYGQDGRPYLDRGHTRPVKLATKPDQSTALELLRRSVRVSKRGFVDELIKRPPPSGWRGSRWLRHHRMVAFDGDQSRMLGQHSVRIDGDLGIVIDKVER